MWSVVAYKTFSKILKLKGSSGSDVSSFVYRLANRELGIFLRVRGSCKAVVTIAHVKITVNRR